MSPPTPRRGRGGSSSHAARLVIVLASALLFFCATTFLAKVPCAAAQQQEDQCAEVGAGGGAAGEDGPSTSTTAACTAAAAASSPGATTTIETDEATDVDGAVPDGNEAAAVTSSKRLVAVPDLHGDLIHARVSFRLAGVASAATGDAWTGGGDTHLVQTGDILDRGGGLYNSQVELCVWNYKTSCYAQGDS